MNEVYDVIGAVDDLLQGNDMRILLFTGEGFGSLSIVKYLAPTVVEASPYDGKLPRVAILCPCRGYAEEGQGMLLLHITRLDAGNVAHGIYC